MTDGRNSTLLCHIDRRLAADLARRVIDVGAGPGRVLVAVLVGRLKQWTEEALAAQIPSSSGGWLGAVEDK